MRIDSWRRRRRMGFTYTDARREDRQRRFLALAPWVVVNVQLKVSKAYGMTLDESPTSFSYFVYFLMSSSLRLLLFFYTHII